MSKKDPLIDLLIHDLTGPLSVVLTCVTNLLNKESIYGPITERQRETLQRILRNSQKAQTFLHDMIEIYRSEEGLFRKGSFSVAHVLRESLCDAFEIIDTAVAEKLSQSQSPQEFEKILKDNRINIEITGKYQTFPFTHDEKKIQQIMRNLITNALKYRRSHMKVTISGDRELILNVEDDGPGIPKDKHDAIFQRFVCSETNDSAGVPGFGFGLSCVKDLLGSMGGEISVHTQEGVGTRFTVRIPPVHEY